MPLTDTRLRALKPRDKPYKVTDERGLYVEVTPTGSKLWRFRYRIGGAQKKLCIGSYRPPPTSIACLSATQRLKAASAKGLSQDKNVGSASPASDKPELTKERVKPFEIGI